MSTTTKPRTRLDTDFLRAGNPNIVVLTVVCVLGALVLTVNSGGTFLSGNSIKGFTTFLAVPILIGLAQMVTLSVGQLNLAVGALGGFSAALMAVLMQDHAVPAVPALLIGVAAATLGGAVNGVIVVVTRINGFIVTLATMTILIGLQYKLVRSFTVDGYSPWLKDLGATAIGPLPLVFLLAVAVAGVLAFFYRRMAVGRRMIAFGGNPFAARLSGISESRNLILAHTLSGLLVGVAAVVSVASLPGINRSVGGDWLLPSFAAPIIGGVALTGGGIAVLGTILAAVLVRLVDAAHSLYSWDPSSVSFIIGAVVLGTVLLSTQRHGLRPWRLVRRTP
ncbi:ABC transporter permease [Nonomuraea sp. NPDC003727]